MADSSRYKIFGILNQCCSSRNIKLHDIDVLLNLYHHDEQNGQQQMQHYKLMMQVLNKRHTGHIESFKKALKTHSEHVQQRQKRVGKGDV